MTPAELDLQRRVAEAIAGQQLAAVLASLIEPELRRRTSERRERLIQAFAREESAQADSMAGQFSLPGAHPAVANLSADLLREAFDSEVERLVKMLRGGP